MMLEADKSQGLQSKPASQRPEGAGGIVSAQRSTGLRPRKADVQFEFKGRNKLMSQFVGSQTGVNLSNSGQGQPFSSTQALSSSAGATHIRVLYAVY